MQSVMRRVWPSMVRALPWLAFVALAIAGADAFAISADAISADGSTAELPPLTDAMASCYDPVDGSNNCMRQ